MATPREGEQHDPAELPLVRIMSAPEELLALCKPVELPCAWCGRTQEPLPGPVLLFACKHCNPESFEESAT
jgi:hypothetical protein